MTILVGNLSWDTEEEDLRDLFNTYGEVTKCTILIERDLGRKRGFGFVEMSNKSLEKTAIDDLQDVEWMGREIRVNKAEQKDSSRRNNKRIIATFPQGGNIMEISNALRKNGFKRAPQNFIPKKLINSLAPLNKEMKSMAAMVNRASYNTDITETISIFNWAPIQLEKTLINRGNSLKNFQLNELITKLCL